MGVGIGTATGNYNYKGGGRSRATYQPSPLEELHMREILARRVDDHAKWSARASEINRQRDELLAAGVSPTLLPPQLNARERVSDYDLGQMQNKLSFHKARLQQDQEKSADTKPTKQPFPTQHPNVQNQDGTVSNSPAVNQREKIPGDQGWAESALGLPNADITIPLRGPQSQQPAAPAEPAAPLTNLVKSPVPSDWQRDGAGSYVEDNQSPNSLAMAGGPRRIAVTPNSEQALSMKFGDDWNNLNPDKYPGLTDQAAQQAGFPHALAMQRHLILTSAGPPAKEVGTEIGPRTYDGMNRADYLRGQGLRDRVVQDAGSATHTQVEPFDMRAVIEQQYAPRDRNGFPMPVRGTATAPVAKPADRSEEMAGAIGSNWDQLTASANAQAAKDTAGQPAATLAQKPAQGQGVPLSNIPDPRITIPESEAEKIEKQIQSKPSYFPGARGGGAVPEAARQSPEYKAAQSADAANMRAAKDVAYEAQKSKFETGSILATLPEPNPSNKIAGNLQSQAQPVQGGPPTSIGNTSKDNADMAKSFQPPPPPPPPPPPEDEET